MEEEEEDSVRVVLPGPFWKSVEGLVSVGVLGGGVAVLVDLRVEVPGPRIKELGERVFVPGPGLKLLMLGVAVGTFVVD